MNYGIFQLINNAAGSWGWLDGMMVFFARDLVYVMIAVLAVLWITGKAANQRMVFYSCLSVVIAIVAAGWIISPIVDHPRPFVDHEVHQLVSHDADPSFPSDHATFAFALAFPIWFLKRRTGGLLLILACLIGIARVYVGVHYPADIAGGLVLGLLISMLVVKYRRWAEPAANFCIGVYGKLTARLSFIPRPTDSGTTGKRSSL
ncbi:undecaprenyl-diphosphatase [Paenibacillus doosanensis]|uniref:undecaprenyl-diphosphatase n=1 Tax=Paenibacillus doosanensis TaxID=1229154 RepID=UPI00217F84F7|nr:undecaprenyl-diphosphatase [Paenibacillus doosanensis]